MWQGRVSESVTSDDKLVLKPAKMTFQYQTLSVKLNQMRKVKAMKPMSLYHIRRIIQKSSG